MAKIKFLDQPKEDVLGLESHIMRNIVTVQDVEYLKRVESALPNAYSEEGIVRAALSDAVSGFMSMFPELKGWVLGIESKRRYINELCDDMVTWLKDKDIEHQGLDLDMGTFKTWMKTSETYMWRYYFLLNDSVWNKIKSDLKNGDITKLENLYDVNMIDRVETARLLDSARAIKDLIKFVETYRERTNYFFENILKRKTKVKSAPFQVILLGASDLRRTVKKIVNLAI